MRRLRYQVAASLDGFIAGPNGEYDWIVHDPSIDFAALFEQFDPAVMDGGHRCRTHAGPRGRDAGDEVDCVLAHVAPG